MTINAGLPPVSQPPDEAPAEPMRPMILWPSFARPRSGSTEPRFWKCADLAHFPDSIAVAVRRTRGDAPSHSPAFLKCVQGAAKQVLIIDRYLLQPGRRAVDQVLSWFPNNFAAETVKIACYGVVKENRRAEMDGDDIEGAEAKVRARFEDRRVEINKFRGAEKSLTLELKLDFSAYSAPHVHDRFAIIDDELWHWGATVGGMHPSTNAVSRGWSADATKAVQFFKEVWEQRDNRKPERRRR